MEKNLDRGQNCPAELGIGVRLAYMHIGILSQCRNSLEAGKRLRRSQDICERDKKNELV